MYYTERRVSFGPSVSGLSVASTMWTQVKRLHCNDPVDEAARPERAKWLACWIFTAWALLQRRLR